MPWTIILGKIGRDLFTRKVRVALVWYFSDQHCVDCKEYQPPQFHKFDGQGGNAKEHKMCFIDDLGIFEQNKELHLREFSKSLTGKAYTWWVPPQKNIYVHIKKQKNFF